MSGGSAATVVLPPARRVFEDDARRVVERLGGTWNAHILHVESWTERMKVAETGETREVRYERPLVAARVVLGRDSLAMVDPTSIEAKFLRSAAQAEGWAALAMEVDPCSRWVEWRPL